MKNNIKHTAYNSKPHLMDDETPFAIKEAFNYLRTNVMYTPHDGEGCPVYVVTSAEMGVGKSTVIANLAVSFANLGKKVLLVDADLRRPSQHKIFGIDSKHVGLSELIAGIKASDTDVIHNTAQGVSVITSGAIPSKPAELICSKVFEQYIESWKNKYDLVLIDMPPVSIVTDPLIIANSVSGYIVVVMANKSTAKRTNSVILTIRQTGAKIVGVVVNSTSMRGEAKHKYAERGYKDGYFSYSHNEKNEL